MTRIAKTSTTYLKFINLVNSLKDLPTFPSLDALETRLINVLATAWQQGTKVSILDAINMIPDISYSTVHGRIKDLKDKGMIDVEIDAHDKRIKYVVPTKKTNYYFEKMGECLIKAQR
ncbi:MAG: winged helix-turn-helix transcriptional regulator [Betaproteobacteria bacterium]|nr:MarR family winged helix-turn-helix transcriptional regulator [Betaproteobacteria bacterium]MDE2423895.1 winged helix-turn-helix transcriptional regulator [Betaproteobacteria bacterium]